MDDRGDEDRPCDYFSLNVFLTIRMKMSRMAMDHLPVCLKHHNLEIRYDDKDSPLTN